MATSMTESKARAAGSSRSAMPPVTTRTGTSAWASARRTTSSWRRLRTITASCDHGTPCSRWRSRSSRAIADHSRAGVVAEMRSMPSPASVASAARAPRWVPAAAAPMRSVTAEVTSRRAGPERWTCCRTTVLTSRMRSTSARRPSTSVSPPRNPFAATSGSPTAMTATPRRARARNRAKLASVASWKSSTITSRRRAARSPGSSDASACTANRASSAWSSCRSRAALITRRYSSMNCAAATHAGRSRSMPRAASRSGVTSNSTVRVISSRSSDRNRPVPRTSGPRSSGQSGPVPSIR